MNITEPLMVNNHLTERVENLTILEHSMPKIVYGLLFYLPDQIKKLRCAWNTIEVRNN
jgi:hypothetical protein